MNADVTVKSAQRRSCAGLPDCRTSPPVGEDTVDQYQYQYIYTQDKEVETDPPASLAQGSQPEEVNPLQLSFSEQTSSQELAYASPAAPKRPDQLQHQDLWVYH